MLGTSFSPWPSFSKEEADAVHKVLLSNKVNYWTGDECRKFEVEFSEWVGSQYAIALANGTVALDACLKALGVGPGDEVVVTSRTFIASVSSIVNTGARPIFADIDPDTQNITSDSIERVLSAKTKAIICVHLAGWPCEMDDIMALAGQRGLYVIEDCAQAHGARYKGRSVGTLGHLAAWSFCQDKIMTTGGEGGMVTTNDEFFWKSIWSLKDHGKSWDAVYKKEHPPGFRWLHESFGTNWRMLEMQAVLGRIQLRQMNEWHARRLQNINRIWAVARSLSCLRVPIVPVHIEHAAYKCYVFVEPHKLAPGWSRDRILADLNAAGVPCYIGSCSEVYLEKAFASSGLAPQQRLPVARQLGETSLMFLVHPTLSDEEISKTCAAIVQVVGASIREAA